MANTFREFQKFDHQEEANHIARLLDDAKIPYEIEIANNYLDSVIVGNINPPQQVIIKLYPDDFKKVDQLLEADAATWLDQIPSDYHLFEFSDEELKEILEKADEWSKEDYLLAQKILRDRGHEISQDYLEELKTKRLEMSREAINASPTLIASGFLAIVMGIVIITFMLLGTLVLPNIMVLLIFGWPLVLGSYLWQTKKTDAVGKRYYYYTSKTRSWGLYMIITAIVSLVILLSTTMVEIPT